MLLQLVSQATKGPQQLVPCWGLCGMAWTGVAQASHPSSDVSGVRELEAEAFITYILCPIQGRAGMRLAQAASEVSTASFRRASCHTQKSIHPALRVLVANDEKHVLEDSVKTVTLSLSQQESGYYMHLEATSSSPCFGLPCERQ